MINYCFTFFKFCTDYSYIDVKIRPNHLHTRSNKLSLTWWYILNTFNMYTYLKIND